MAIKYQTSRDAQTKRFEFRPGVNSFPGWEGIEREPGDPGSTPPNAVWTAINTRFNGVSFISRGGQSEWNAPGETGCIWGIFDFEGVDGGGIGSGALMAGGPFHIARYDELATTAYFRYPYPLVSGTLPFQDITPADTNLSSLYLEETVLAKIKSNRCLFKANAKLYGIGDGYISSLLNFSGTPAIYQINYGATTLVYSKVFDLPIRCTYVNVFSERSISAAGAVDVVEDVVYLSGINDHKLYRWSQATGFTSEDTGGPSYRFVMEKYRENIYTASRDSVRRRDAAGSYTNIPLPAIPGGKGHFFAWSMAVYKDKLYIGGACYDDTTHGGFDPNNAIPAIMVYDGASITVARQLPQVDPFRFGIVNCFTVINNVLYFSYEYGASALGKYDGTTWTDLLLNPAITETTFTSTYDGVFVNILYNGKDILLLGNGGAESGGAMLAKANNPLFDNSTILAHAEGGDNPPHGQLILVDQD